MPLGGCDEYYVNHTEHLHFNLPSLYGVFCYPTVISDCTGSKDVVIKLYDILLIIRYPNYLLRILGCVSPLPSIRI